MKTKLFSMLLASFVAVGSISAQKGGEKKSPAAETVVTHGDAKVTINYSQPSMRGRTIYGDLVPYGKIWRTGANEATTFTCNQDIKINGHELPAGTYSFFTIPGEKEWTVIFNSEAEQWGAYKYNEKKDVLRFTVKPTKTEKTETMTFLDGKDGLIYLDWEETRIKLSFK